MKEAGVTGVMNVQTDEDIHKRQVNMELMKQCRPQTLIIIDLKHDIVKSKES